MASVLNSLFGKQYTISDLMNIDAGRQMKSMSCTVKLVKVFHETKKESLLDKFKSMFFSKKMIDLYYITLKLEVTSDNGSKYYVFIRISADFGLSNYNTNKIKVYCECNDFKFRSAYLLNKNNSLFINDRIKIKLGPAINDAPKNKTKTTTLCKHSYAALNWLVSNYNTVMKSI